MANTSETIAAAHSLYENDRVNEAFSLLQCSIGRDPDNGKLLEMLGVLLHVQGSLCKAMNVLEQASSLIPLSHGSQMALADCYRRREFPESARVIYLHLAKQSDISTRLLSDLSIGLSALGEMHAALNVCREAARRDPDSDQALFGIAHFMEKCGYPCELILPVLEQVVQLAPHNIRYRVSLAVAYGKAGNRDRAIELVDKLSGDQLAAIRCSNCLRKVGALFLYGGDEDRGRHCLNRAHTIEQARSTSLSQD